jgi:hypothetical protein
MNRRTIIIPFVIVCVSLLVSCSDEPTPPAAELMLMYQESEPGMDPYMTRVLVNKQYMRLDEGADQSNFTLYDRQKNIIYTVSHENRTIMQVTPVKSNNKIERKLILDAKKLDDSSLPSIEGQQPVHYQLQVNDKFCADVYVIKGLHEEAIQAMAGFKRILASIHLSTINNTPADMQDECFLAHDVLSPSRSMQFGFPILEQGADGVARLLVDFDRQYKTGPEVYKLPQDYRMINMAGTAIDSESL